MTHLSLLGSVLVLAAVVMSWASAASAASDDLAALKPQLRQSLMFDFPTLGEAYPVNIYYVDETTGDEVKDVILYVINDAWERIGTESDLSILTDYIEQGFIVMTLNFGDAPEATSPAIDNDINLLHRAIFGYRTPSILRAIDLEPNPVRCFIIPAGYRVATNLTYWEIDRHGVHGTLDWVMKVYNDQVVPRHEHLEPVDDPADMVTREGEPFDYRIQMDIVYPSNPERSVPVFVYSETQASRNVHHRYLFQLRGYAYVVMGHCFNPVITHYGHMRNFTLDHWNGFLCYTAGVRYLNKHAERYHLDTDRIGMMGVSKGQYAVTRLSDPNHVGGPASSRFGEFPPDWDVEPFPEGSPEPQPWQGYPSQIHAGWQGQGMGLWKTQYITPDYVPTILACGEHDREVITDNGNPLFLARLEELDVNHVNLFMEGLGHGLSYGYDERLGVDRYQLVIDFFDRYLRIEEDLPPVVLIATPRDAARDIDPASELWVQFAPVIDAGTILSGEGIKVSRLEDGAPVAGAWRVSHGGTKFTFAPEQPLQAGTRYEVAVTDAVRDEAGTALAEPRTMRFTTAQ